MGCIKDVASSPITTAVEDVGLAATGNAWAIPLANAATRTVGGVASGESFGKALGQGAIRGGEAFAGQEVAGAFGIGSGNTAVNDALGIDISPAATGLPDVGGFLSKGFDSASSALGFTSGGTAAPVAGTGTGGVMLDAGGQTLTSAPASTTTVSSPGGGFQSASQALGASDSSINSILDAGSVSGASAVSPTELGSVGGSSPTLAAGASAAPVGTAPSGAASASAPTSGGFMSSLEGAAGKAALPLGALAYESLKGPAPLPSAALPLTASGAVTQPLINTETAGLNNYNNGTLTQPQQAQVLRFVQDSQNQLIQQLVNSGSTDFKNDSRYIQGMQDIQTRSIAMQNEMLQQTFNNAFSAAGAAGQNLGTVANEQVTNDKDFQDALAAAFAGVGTAAGGGTFRAAA